MSAHEVVEVLHKLIEFAALLVELMAVAVILAAVVRLELSAALSATSFKPRPRASTKTISTNWARPSCWDSNCWWRPMWSESTSVLGLSPAGWWHALVSLPLLLLIFLGWLWRLALWTRFLFLMSRLDLRLIPGHPDRVGGLMFVSLSLRGFRLVSFACGAVVAGSIANRQVLQSAQPLHFKNLVIGLLVFLLILFAGPLTIFVKKLRETERRGFLEYGALARAVGTQFEAKWLRQNEKVDETSLEVPDFSATTDLYSVTANVYALRTVPFTLRDLIGPIGVAAMLPFIPLALLAMPLDMILSGLLKLLF